MKYQYSVVLEVHTKEDPKLFHKTLVVGADNPKAAEYRAWTDAEHLGFRPLVKISTRRIA